VRLEKTGIRFITDGVHGALLGNAKEVQNISFCYQKKVFLSFLIAVGSILGPLYFMLFESNY